MHDTEPKETPGARPVIWLLLADKQGDNKQVFSLADNLGYPYQTRFVYPKSRFAKGKPFFRPSVAHIDLARSDAIAPPWPDVIITIGRRPTMAALWIRRRSGGHTRIILIGRQPRYLREFALVIASCQYITANDPRIVRIALPLDDGLRRVNAPAAAPAPPGHAAASETALLIGGPTRSFRLGVAEAHEMMRLATLHGGGAPLRIVTSRRTPADVCAWFSANLPGSSRLCAWQPGAHTTSDYAEALAQCARFIVTGDSVSMICDVVREGKALAIYRLPFRNALYDRWHRLIIAVAPIDDRRIVDSRLIRLPRSFDAFYSYLFRHGSASDLAEGFLPAYSFTPEQDLERATQHARRVVQACRA